MGGSISTSQPIVWFVVFNMFIYSKRMSLTSQQPIRQKHRSLKSFTSIWETPLKGQLWHGRTDSKSPQPQRFSSQHNLPHQSISSFPRVASSRICFKTTPHPLTCLTVVIWSGPIVLHHHPKSTHMIKSTRQWEIGYTPCLTPLMQNILISRISIAGLQNTDSLMFRSNFSMVYLGVSSRLRSDLSWSHIASYAWAWKSSSKGHRGVGISGGNSCSRRVIVWQNAHNQNLHRFLTQTISWYLSIE